MNAKAQSTSRRSVDDVRFRFPSRTDNVRKYLTDYHSNKWTEYCDPEDNSKKTFFDKELPYIEKIESHFRHRDVRVYEITRPIIDTEINKIILSSSMGERQIIHLQRLYQRLMNVLIVSRW